MEMILACRNHPDEVENLRYCNRCAQPFCPDCLVTIKGNCYCASCKSEQLLDLVSGVDASGIELAGNGRRFGAMVIDWLILSIPLWIGVAVLIIALLNGKANFNPIWIQISALGYLVIYVAYEGLMLAARGQTVGKIVMKVRVVRPDGTPISTGQAWGRAFMRQILSSCLSIFDYLPAFFTKDKTCLHDLVANTRVVNWSG